MNTADSPLVVPNAGVPESLSKTTALCTQWMKVPPDVRSEAETWRRMLAECFPVPDEAQNIGQTLADLARRMRVSPATARRRFDVWRCDTQDTLALLNRSRARLARKRPGLSSDFIEWWQGLQIQFGRKSKPAYREFHRRFMAGEMIPGIPPGICRDFKPLGYSESSLSKIHPTPFEATAARIGRAAAAAFRPKVITTRVGLHVGEFMEFDDLWHDFEVVLRGRREPMRLLQLHALDVYSACQFARGIKLRARDEETGKRINLRNTDMLLLLAHVLGHCGFYRGGVTLKVELGTAAIDTRTEALLYDLSKGLIRVVRSGVVADANFCGQYAGAGKGNFRFKARVESSHNLVHNETANRLTFPGQTGSNSRLNVPQELAGREKYMDELTVAILALPESVRAKIVLPFPEANFARQVLDEVQEIINRRTDHQLEGYEKCGLTTVDYVDPELGAISAARFATLSPERQQLVAALARPVCRMLSPREVYDAGQADLIRLTPAQTAALLELHEGREVVVTRDHEIRFEDKLIAPGTLRFWAHHWAPGTKFRAVVNPFSLGEAHLFDARGGWVGVTPAREAACIGDYEALARQQEEVAHAEGVLLRPLRKRGLEMAQQTHETHAANRRLLGDHQAAEAAIAAEYSAA